MTGTFRRSLSWAVWIVATLGLTATGCQQVTPSIAQSYSHDMRVVRQRPAPDNSGVVQAGYNSMYAPSVVPAVRTEPAIPTLPPPQKEPGAAPNGYNGHAVLVPHPAPEVGDDKRIPRELEKTLLPAYIIEPPDTLIIDTIRLVPRPPYRIEPLDVLVIQVAVTLPNQPVAGPYPVSPEGMVQLGYSYGSVRVAGLTLEQAGDAIRAKLRDRLNEPQVAVALASFRGVQQVRGEHLVTPDGTISLGSYGCVNVTGLTIWQAKLVIERHLSKFLLNPEISLSVGGYNSKVYYVIYDGAGFGQQILRLPVTGNETVLDGIANAGGLPPVASRRRIWLARPSPKNCYQILAVDWEVITRGGDPTTNWQLMPGDRIFVDSDPFIRADNTLAKIFAPIERILGITLLGATTFETLQGNGFGNNNNN